MLGIAILAAHQFVFESTLLATHVENFSKAHVSDEYYLTADESDQYGPKYETFLLDANDHTVGYANGNTYNICVSYVRNKKVWKASGSIEQNPPAWPEELKEIANGDQYEPFDEHSHWTGPVGPYFGKEKVTTITRAFAYRHEINGVEVGQYSRYGYVSIIKDFSVVFGDTLNT